MKVYRGIFLSSQINKYGYKFSIEAIEKSLFQKWNTGTPMFISHDYTRPLGWSKPIGIYISPIDVRLYGKGIVSESAEEKNIIAEKSKRYLDQNIFNIEDKYQEILQNTLGEYLSGNEVYMRRECLCVIDENLVSKVLPELNIDETNKRNLISLKDLSIIGSGIFEYKGYTIFAHRYFRRNMSDLNNLNDIFFKKFLALKDNPDLDVKIAIDPHTIGLKDTYLEAVELEYWWGPKFSDSLLEIPEGVSCYKADDKEKYFHGIDETQFWWHKQNEIQSLECEELRDIPSYGISDDKYACRYVHSMIDENTGLANHLDGAVRIYDEESFLERLDLDISKSGKNTEYIKLWRVDGDIDISLWKELLNDFYRDNRLIGEYLLGNDLNKNNNKNKNNMNDEENEYMTITLLDYISVEDGYNIFLSYHDKSIFTKHNEIDIIDDEIEYCSLDLLKLIKEEYKDKLYINPDVKYIAYEDLDINFPLIIHRGKNAVENANKTMESIHKLCKKFYENNEDRVITFNIGIEYKEFIATFAFASNAKTIYLFCSKNMITFPIFENLGKWSDNQHDFLQKSFRTQKISSNFLNKSSSCFQIKRFIVNEYIEIDDKGIVSLKVPEEQKALAEAVANGLLKIVPVFMIYKGICSKCNQDYSECGCYAFLDDNCKVNIENGESVGFIAATRTA